MYIVANKNEVLGMLEHDNEAAQLAEELDGEMIEVDPLDEPDEEDYMEFLATCAGFNSVDEFLNRW